jgi:uncharacterized damage-inducible protein DinB
VQLITHFQTLARYNRVANERIYEKCAQLSDVEYRETRSGSFGSIHRLLNHMLLGDRIWMSRFEGGGTVTPPLNTMLFEEFAPLRSARATEDARIESFFNALNTDPETLSFAYINNQGKNYVESGPVAFGHFFNHQTHHRGQIHVMLSQTTVAPPPLDLHRIVNP